LQEVSHDPQDNSHNTRTMIFKCK